MAVIGYVLGGLVGLIILLIGLVKIMGFIADKGAEKRGKQYFFEKGYEFKKVEAYPNHHELFLAYQKMQIYASFDYERDGS